MTRFRRVLAVANPAAGLRAGRDAGEAAARGARDAGARVELARTTGPGDAERLAARAASEGIDLVLAVGGDGTVHEAANPLAGSRTALGVAPAGTMNLLARILALPLDPGAAARTIVARPRVAEMPPGNRGRPALPPDARRGVRCVGAAGSARRAPGEDPLPGLHPRERWGP